MQDICRNKITIEEKGASCMVISYQFLYNDFVKELLFINYTVMLANPEINCLFERKASLTVVGGITLRILHDSMQYKKGFCCNYVTFIGSVPISPI